jgi:hypothetical protein
VDPAIAAAVADEGAKRAGLIWVRRLDTATPPRPLWYAWIDGSAYALTGGDEQPPPEGIAADVQVEVTITSKDKRSRLIGVVATAEPIVPTSAEWDAVVPVLRSKRLNLADGDEAVDRWARESALWRLRPKGEYTD